MTALAAGGIVPAQLGFLAIFNPSLGDSDDTIDDQIVYYASVTTQISRKKRRAKARPTDSLSQEERHERLRQIGLAQGMVNFSRGFSDGAPVDAIDTEKSRVIAHELEPGWWILASVDLNKVPLPPRLPTRPDEKPEERYEYTSREMKPAVLLLRDLLRAHGIFLLHHDSSLSSLFARCRRSRFVAMLNRFWDLFLSTWSVMMHGNPIRDVFGGINVAASGELGVGVGEEERGSGEREVLEGLVGRVEGLVDLVVSRFGTDDSSRDSKRAAKSDPEPWLGSGKEPSVEDGVIFLGTGALSRRSLGDVTHWMEDIYTWGEHAYGVIESPTSIRRVRDSRVRDSKSSQMTSCDAKQTSGTDPFPASTSQQLIESIEAPGAQTSPVNNEDLALAGKDGSNSARMGKMVSYLTLGYGSYWSLPGALASGTPTPKDAVLEIRQAQRDEDKKGSDALPTSTGQTLPLSDSPGRYLIGLLGEIEDEASNDPVGASSPADAEAEDNSRTVVRTVYVELEAGIEARFPGVVARDFGQDSGKQHPTYHDSHDAGKTEKLRVVVYVNKPFIFTFLFGLETDSLAWDTLYRSLHYQLAPLRKPLLASTKYRPERPDAGPVASSIHDLVWDPQSLTVHSTIPNIPDYSTELPQTWSRADAVSTHNNLLNIQAATRTRATDVERTQKTNRGWWIVWTRILQRQMDSVKRETRDKEMGKQRERKDKETNLGVIRESARSSASSLDSPRRHNSHSPAPGRGSASSPSPGTVGKEIYLIRRASDHVGYLTAGDDTGGGGGSDGAGRLAQGIGVDTRRYVEELLSLF